MKQKHAHKKYFGQNFLVDPRIKTRIIESCSLYPSDRVVEIGPGQGAITRLIMPHVKSLVCIEKDKDLIENLKQDFLNTNVTIIQADFLNYDLTLENNTKIIGNIPYNISTPIIEKLILNRSHVNQAYLTVQQEFAERLAAKPGGKDYGALSCFAQYHADVKILFKIKNSCFKPMPKVDSCFICLDFTAPQKFFPKDKNKMFQLIRTVFTQRRKNILNAAQPIVNKEAMLHILEIQHISPNARPETLSLQNFVDISNGASF